MLVAAEDPALEAWRNDQVAQTYCHASFQGGSFSRLLAYIALNSTPSNPWVPVSTRISGAVFKTSSRGNGASMVTRMLQSGLVLERPSEKPSKRADTRHLRLNLTCNALCGSTPGHHAFDTTYSDVLRWLSVTADELAELLATLPPHEAEAYKRLLRESSRIDLAPAPCHLTDGDAITGLIKRKLIRERNSTEFAKFVPVLNPLGGGEQ